MRTYHGRTHLVYQGYNIQRVSDSYWRIDGYDFRGTLQECIDAIKSWIATGAA